MMSRFLTGISKPSPLGGGFRLFSSSSVFLRLGFTVKEDTPEVILFDAAKEDTVTVPDTTLPQELADSRVIGVSNGWGFFSDLSDRSLCISDCLNPLTASKSNPKVIPLPPLTALYTCQTQVFCNVAMSSSSPCDDEDCVVAVKFLGRQLSLCRPNRDLRWTNILAPFTFLENSNLMFSHRDHRFYLPAPGSNHLCSWDLSFKDPKFHQFLYHNRPKLSQSEYCWICVTGQNIGWSHPQGNVSSSGATTSTHRFLRKNQYSGCTGRKK